MPSFPTIAHMYSCRVSRFVRTPLDYSIKEDEKFSGTRYKVGRVVSRGYGGELLSSEREAEGNLRESISPGQSYRAYVSSVCLWRGMRNISSGLISRLSCISFLPSALPSRSLPGINLFSFLRRNADDRDRERDETE